MLIGARPLPQPRVFCLDTRTNPTSPLPAASQAAVCAAHRALCLDPPTPDEQSDSDDAACESPSRGSPSSSEYSFRTRATLPSPPAPPPPPLLVLAPRRPADAEPAARLLCELGLRSLVVSVGGGSAASGASSGDADADAEEPSPLGASAAAGEEVDAVVVEGIGVLPQIYAWVRGLASPLPPPH